jgi:tetratricopeptide (TPR) repeat protein
MKKVLITVLVAAALLAGCNRGKEFKTQREESYARWNATRATIAYGVAAEHLRVGQLKDARLKAMEALALDEDLHEARLVLGKVYIEQGAYSLALMELKRVQLAQPDHAEVAYLLGVAYEKDHKYPEALDQYQLAHALDPANAAAVVAAGEVLVSTEQVDQAQQLLEANMELATSEPAMFELAGRVAMMRKEYDKAARYYQHACDQTGGNVRYRESLARALFQGEQFAQAEEAIMILLATDGYQPPAWVATMLGDSRMALGKMLQARDAYQQAAKINENSAQVWVNLSKAYLALNDYPRATQSARRALSLETQNADAAMLLGYSQLRDSKPNAAVATLRQAVQAHDDNSMLHTLLGQAYAAVGNRSQAKGCYERALELDPTNSLARELLEASGSRQVSRAG